MWSPYIDLVNMLLPIELERAMSPKPFLATITLVIRSGILVPAAKKVSPITCTIGNSKYNVMSIGSEMAIFVCDNDIVYLRKCMSIAKFLVHHNSLS